MLKEPKRIIAEEPTAQEYSKKEAKFKMAFGGSFSPKSSLKFPPNLMIKYDIL